MKLGLSLGLILLLSTALLAGGDVFTIIPQPIGVRQWGYVLVTLATYMGLIVLHLMRKGERHGLYLFFFMYPFLAQTIYYLNISTPFLILSPAFLYLTFHVLLLRDHALPISLQILFLFCLSTMISVVIANNKYTAFAFCVLAVGGFALCAYAMYVGVKTSRNPLLFVRRIILSTVAGSLIYFIIETIAFQIRPGDIIHILMRRWNELPLGRYYTGGFREPAGLGFVYSFLLWIMLAIAQTTTVQASKTRRRIDRGAILVIVFFLLAAGTRGAVVNLINIFLVLWILNRLGLQSLFRLKKSYLLVIGVIAAVSAYLLLPRTVLITRSQPLPPWIEPTYVSVGGRTFELVGTTPGYVKQTIITLQDFLQNPLGAGPLNAPPIWDKSEGAVGYYYSIVSNMFVIGATFGWLSLLLWMGFACNVTVSLLHLKRTSLNSHVYTVSIVLLATLLASFLPGSHLLGPSLNWSGFDSRLPLSQNTLGLPSEYPAIISGFILGSLVGLVEWIRTQNKMLTMTYSPSLFVETPRRGDP